jgi:hypothetical protein
MATTIDFKQPIEVIVMALVQRIDRMETDLYADGVQPGALKRLETFLTDHTAREQERAKAQAKRDEDMNRRHDQNRFRLNVIIALVGIGIPILFATLTHWKH